MALVECSKRDGKPRDAGLDQLERGVRVALLLREVAKPLQERRAPLRVTRAAERARLAARGVRRARVAHVDAAAGPERRVGFLVAVFDAQALRAERAGPLPEYYLSLIHI